MTWSQFSIGNEVVNSPQRISIAEYDDDPGQQTVIEGLRTFVRTLDAEEYTSEPHVGFLKLKEKQYQLETPTTMQGSPSHHIECLDHFLADRLFSALRKNRICLALSLSHAILSFYSAPWIEACWIWRDFCIDRENDDQLFATRKFYSSHISDLISASRESVTSDLWVINEEPTLTTLGLALIEFAIGKRLVEMRSENQYQSSHPDTLDFLDAKILVSFGGIMRAESQENENVINACLRHHFIRSSELVRLDSSQPNFQEDVEQSIIAPLHIIVTDSWGNL